MSGTDSRTEGQLPVTGEVGSEGGSFADPTVQVATFEGDVARTRAAAGREAPDRSGGFVRYPTEQPDSPGASKPRQGFDWRTGLAGAAVGVLVAMAASRFRR